MRFLTCTTAECRAKARECEDALDWTHAAFWWHEALKRYPTKTGAYAARDRDNIRARYEDAARFAKTPCTDCNGHGSVPSIGPETGEDNGHVPCPTCTEGGAS
jgi:hypothetical protein